MTIDKGIFGELIDELQIYYKREFTPFAWKVWYKHLSARLTTQQFQEAVERAIVSRQFMPTPEELVECVKGNSEAISLQEWDKCLAASASGQSVDSLELSPSGKFALRAIGGLQQLGQSEMSEHKWIRKEFMSAWKSWTPSDALSLPAAEVSTPLSDYIANMDAVEYMKLLTQKMSLNGKLNTHDEPNNG